MAATKARNAETAALKVLHQYKYRNAEVIRIQAEESASVILFIDHRAAGPVPCTGYIMLDGTQAKLEVKESWDL